MTTATGAMAQRRMRVAENAGAREGVVVELRAAARKKGFILQSIEPGEQHATGLRSHGVHDRRDLLDSLALAEQRLIQSDSSSALEIDFELLRHTRECMKALPLR
jgi:hypothetical protein